MASAAVVNPSADANSEKNSKEQIIHRLAAGKITWAGPLIVVMGRTVLIFIAQAIVACILLLRHHPSPWIAAGPWWTVYGTIADIGCLLLMAYFTRAEGIRLRDLIGKIRLRRGHDIFTGLGWFALIFPFFLGGGWICTRLLYGPAGPVLPPGFMMQRNLPMWGMVYSLSLWWMIWSPTEEMTYNAYAFPRLEALFGKSWMALALVGFWWALQHSFLQLLPDWRFMVWRTVSFIPGVLVCLLIYRRTRRLPPLILAHWMMDFSAVMATLKF
jgi:hypothetical protein